MVDFKTVKTRLDENNLIYEVLELSKDAKIIVSAYGGRIFGPFINDGNSLCWINPCFESSESFRTFLERKEWNLGGDRIWIAPELQYNVPDKNDFWGSYKVPEAIDPGSYILENTEEDILSLTQLMNLDVYDNETGKKSLNIARTIKPVSDLPYNINTEEILLFGYDHEIHLKEDKRDNVVSEVWNLLQFNPEGTLYIPTTAAAEYSEYYEPFDKGYQNINEKFVELKIDAKKQYKVGYKSLYTIGRSGYISTYGDKSYLMLRSFYNDPTGPYVKSPSGKLKDGGHALHVYNDDGNIGDFAEHECSCLPIGGHYGRSESIEKISTIFCVGSKAAVKNMIKLYLGIEI